MSKYRNRKTELNGILFDSKREADRYAELRLLKKAGLIKDLKLQPKFTLVEPFVNGKGKKIRSMVYIADFGYYDLERDKYIVEDTKGVKTEAYRIKKKLFENKYHPLVIEEI